MTTLQEIEKRFRDYKLEECGKWKIDRAMAEQFYRTEIQALLEGLVKEIVGIIERGGTSETILTIQHNSEEFINARQLVKALSEIKQKVQEIIK